MANNNVYVISAWNFVIDMNAGDYLQLMWSSTTTDMEMSSIPPQTSPTRPATPSLIVTMVQI
jgi:hypothetical protein